MASLPLIYITDMPITDLEYRLIITKYIYYYIMHNIAHGL